ncbi:MauE/DoxX family redox-associated membrane protein [Pedobacter foliorum]|uniref:MauE/DoxX family redox-associated membrane protein n=1 Tax=Pedobacter foliorum TaxID=2739058 RepID=UPI003741ED9E
MLKVNQGFRIKLVDFISALFVLLFIYAAMSKFHDFEKFRIELGKSPILNVISNYVAIFIPSSEIGISILLFSKRYQFLGLYASFSLMVIFSGYIVIILKFSTYIPCSCGGILQNMTWNQHLIFNIVFIVLSIISILIYPNKNLICSKREYLHPE